MDRAVVFRQNTGTCRERHIASQGSEWFEKASCTKQVVASGSTTAGVTEIGAGRGGRQVSYIHSECLFGLLGLWWADNFRRATVPMIWAGASTSARRAPTAFSPS